MLKEAEEGTMKFSFTLQSLLNWKESLEEESRLNVARKKILLKRQEEEIQELMNRREKNDRELHQRMGKGLSIEDFLVYKQFGEKSYDDLVQLRMKRRETEEKIEEERVRLVGLMKERKILEKLKERRMNAFRNEMEKQEQKQLDEMALRSYCRGAQENEDTVTADL